MTDTNLAGGRPASEDIDEGRFNQAFPTISPSQIKVIEPYGKRVHFSMGEQVWSPGDMDLPMYVVLSGEMLVVDGQKGTPLVSYREGMFSGDTGVICGRASVVGAVAATDLELLEVPADGVRAIVGEKPDLGEVILRAFLLRRSLLVERVGTGVVVIGSRYSPDTLRIREFLGRNDYPVVWEDLEARPDTARMLREFEVNESETPIVVLADGRILRAPSNSELAEALGIKRRAEAKVYDLLIVGAGPAGLAAAVYGASEGLETLLVDVVGPGGQAGTSSKIENYMGFPLGISGHELAERALVQASKFGARMIVPSEALSIGCNATGGQKVELDEMGCIESKCVILAPGAQYRKLEIEGLERFEGRGIYYAATHIEQVLCTGSHVAVVGGGNSAGQAAVFMAENTLHVYLVVRGRSLRENMSSYLATRIERSDKITVLLNSEVCDLDGSDHLEEIAIRDNESGEVRRERVPALFVMIGAVPRTSWLPNAIACDTKGFILTGPALLQEDLWREARPPLFLETSCPGVFAAGDARASSIKRVASAVGEGAMSVSLVHQFLAQ